MAETLVDLANWDYRESIARAANGEPDELEALRGVLILAGRSAQQREADVELLRQRREATAALEAAQAMEADAAELEGKLAAERKATDTATRKAQEAVAKAQAVVAEHRATLADLESQLREVRQRQQAMAAGRREFLVETSDPEITASIASLNADRGRVADSIALADRDTAPLVAERDRLKAEADLTDERVKYYLGVKTYTQRQRLTKIALEIRTHGDGSRPSESGNELTHVKLPEWLRPGWSEVSEELFESQPKEAVAERGRLHSQRLREEAAKVQAQIDAIEKAREAKPARLASLATLERKVGEQRDLLLVAENFRLTS